MSTEEKTTQNGPLPPENSTTRRTFIGMGIKGIALLPYVAPIVETYLIGTARADDDGGGDGGGDDGGDDGDNEHRISRPPNEEEGEESEMERTNADER